MTREQASECERVAIEFIFCSILIRENRIASDEESRKIFRDAGGTRLKTHDDFRKLYDRLCLLHEDMPF